MKKVLVLAALVAVALQASAFAAEVQGTVKSVVAAESKLELTTETGDQAVVFTAATKWDDGVTDPSTLVGKTVKVVSNDETKAVESVNEVK
jgi:hypothetical protein